MNRVHVLFIIWGVVAYACGTFMGMAFNDCEVPETEYTLVSTPAEAREAIRKCGSNAEIVRLYPEELKLWHIKCTYAVPAPSASASLSEAEVN